MNSKREEHRRFLSPEEKARELAWWEEAKRQPLPAGLLGGRGFVDREIAPWCDQLNRLPDLCTLQSCAGHAARPGHHEIAGHLWLWLSPAMAEVFEEDAFELATTQGIDRVAKFYQPYGREIIAITFNGNERGELNASIATVVSFFEKLQKRIWRPPAVPLPPSESFQAEFSEAVIRPTYPITEED